MPMQRRIHIVVRGAVQGVGFRPFIYRLASELKLPGWVLNASGGVVIEAEGDKCTLDNFLLRIGRDKPPRSFIQSMEFAYFDPAGLGTFAIRESDASGAPATLITPDIAPCPECLAEIFDPANRRALYPFTNCTNCGPRFTIIEALPYDRAKTTMKRFAMCPKCRGEYENPLDRRFHAQPNACPECGPHLELWAEGGTVLASHHEALLECARLLRDGRIVAVKGVGGFHLVVDARNEEAVVALRKRKHREEKPFALMAPTLDAVRELCVVSDLEQRALLSPEAPIVLVARRSGSGDRKANIAPNVAPDNPYLGMMLPSSPLHHILLRELGFPVVATSGNISDEPICTDEREALVRLHGIADAFLVHDRPIVRHVDDSIVRVMMGRELVLRRARGLAPLPIALTAPSAPTLAVGAHLKNTVALSRGSDVFLSQHIGDLETNQSYEAFRRAIDDLRRLLDIAPDVIASDLHPDYLSTKYAHMLRGIPAAVQHHHAHIAACMADNALDGPVLGVAWDGTGLGTDGTIWGGEFLLASRDSFERVATFRPFPLPGGDTAIQEPRRTALGILYDLLGEKAFTRKDLPSVAAFTDQELALLHRMLSRKINTPMSSSAGRLFDAVASLTGLRQRNSFEGQSAMALEFAATSCSGGRVYGFEMSRVSPSLLHIEWAPTMWGILRDLQSGVPVQEIAAAFHNTLAAIIVETARRVGQERVVLAGGCFQNAYLTERTVRSLEREGFRPYWHQRVPPNDGSIALGQLVVAAGLHTKGVGSSSPPRATPATIPEKETSGGSRL
ncbi:MAG TPA: carbamoyltransferase HypF [Bacteroidota bacterium]|nr:carbamoyltransferase HypF [Bacteroidota bacterium]